MKLLPNILTNGRIPVFIMAICLMAAALCGCADSDLPSTRVPGQEENLGFRLELKIGFDNASSSVTRSDPEPTTDPGLPTIQGNKFENTIKTLTIFVFNSSGTPVVGSPTTLDENTCTALPFTASSENDYLHFWTYIENIPYDKYTVYVAANLSPKQISELAEELANTTNPSQFYNLDAGHLNVAAELTSATYGMAMSCNDPDTFDFTPSKTGGICTFHLKRIVAKVLVTAETTDGKYVKVHTEEGQDPKFMVLLDDVSFTVNSVNTHTFLYQRGTSNPKTVKPYVLDPNEGITTGTENQFIYNSIKSWANFTSYFKKVKQHDPDKYELNKYNAYPKDDEYDESIIYFPENTFAIPDPVPADVEKQVTHVIIRAKITPLTLMVTKGFKDFAAGEVGTDLYNLIAAAEDEAVATNPEVKIYPIHCSKPEYSPLISELSLKYENFLGAMSNTTFFMKVGDTNKDIYTYSAAKYVSQGTEYVHQAGNTLKLKDFEVYNDGYANYTVFFDDPRTGFDSEHDDPWKRSQIFRNTYYIINITEFTSPGHGLDPEEDYIQVHTEVVPYKNSWKGVINIDDDTPTAQ